MRLLMALIMLAVFANTASALIVHSGDINTTIYNTYNSYNVTNTTTYNYSLSDADIINAVNNSAFNGSNIYGLSGFTDTYNSSEQMIQAVNNTGRDSIACGDIWQSGGGSDTNFCSDSSGISLGDVETAGFVKNSTAGHPSYNNFSGAWGDLSGVPAGFADNVDNDTTYSALSEFTNDVGFITSFWIINWTWTNITYDAELDAAISGNITGFATLADIDSAITGNVTPHPQYNNFSGNYADLVGAPGSYNNLSNTDISTAISGNLTGYATIAYVNTAIDTLNNFSGAYSDLTGAPGDYNNLSASQLVNFSGDYNDLSNKPTHSQYLNDSWSNVTYDAELDAAITGNLTADTDHSNYLNVSWTNVTYDAELAAAIAGNLTDTNCAANNSCTNITYDIETSAWDKNAADDFSGAWGDISGIPADIADGDNDTTYDLSRYVNDTWSNNTYDIELTAAITGNVTPHTVDTNCSAGGSCGLVTYDTELDAAITGNASGSFTYSDYFDQGLNTTSDVSFSSVNGVYYVQADNASDIQAKIDLAAAAGGGTVVIPNGNYTINTQITLPSTIHVKIVGVGRDNTILKVNTTYGIKTSNNSFVDISHLTMLGIQDFSDGVVHAIHSQEIGDPDYNVDYYVNDVLFDHFTTALRQKSSITFTNNGNIIIINSEFRNFDDLENWGLTYEVVAFQFIKPNNKVVLLENNFCHDIDKNESKCFEFNGRNNVSSQGVIIKNNIIQNVSSDGIYLHSTSNSIIEGNQIYNYGQDNGSHRDAIAINSNDGSLVINNIVEGGFGRPLRTDQTINSLFSNNILFGGSNGYLGGISKISSVSYNQTWSNNYFRSDKSPAFYLEAGSQNNLFSNNRFFGEYVDITDLGTNNLFYNNYGRGGLETEWDKDVSDDFNLYTNLTDGLISYINFEGNVNDIYGVSTTTLHNSTYTDGKIGRGLDCDGIGDYLGISDLALNPYNGTINLWYKKKSDIAGGEYMLQSSLNVRTYIYHTSSLALAKGNPQITQLTGWNEYNEWAMVTMVWHMHNSTYLNLTGYLNGVYVGSKYFTATNAASTMSICAFGSGANKINATVDELGVWDNVKSAAEISALYNNGYGLPAGIILPDYPNATHIQDMNISITESQISDLAHYTDADAKAAINGSILNLANSYGYPESDPVWLASWVYGAVTDSNTTFWNGKADLSDLSWANIINRPGDYNNITTADAVAAVAAADDYVLNTGDTMADDLNMTGHNVTSVDCIRFSNGAAWCGI